MTNSATEFEVGKLYQLSSRWIDHWWLTVSPGMPSAMIRRNEPFMVLDTDYAIQGTKMMLVCNIDGQVGCVEWARVCALRVEFEFLPHTTGHNVR
jgi:hypothetical protein